MFRRSLFLVLFLPCLMWGRGYQFYSYGDYTFKIDSRLAKLPEGKPESVLKSFLEKGGTLHRMLESSAPFVLEEGDAVFPICSGGWCRSQTLYEILVPYASILHLYPPHAARYGWDPYDGELHRDFNLKQEVLYDEYSKCFGHEKYARIGFENDAKWMSCLGKESDADLQEMREYFNKHYYGVPFKGRRVYFTFSANTHVVMHRLVEANVSLSNVLVVGYDFEDIVTHPREEWQTFSRSAIAYDHFKDLLGKTLEIRVKKVVDR